MQEDQIQGASNGDSQQVSTQPIAPQPAEQITPQQPVQPAPAPQAQSQQQPQSPYAPEQNGLGQQSVQNNIADSIVWTASEYVDNTKDKSWYTGLILVAVLVAAILYLITRDLVSSGVAIFGALLLGVYGARRPRQLTYELSNEGLIIGEKRFAYHELKTFALVPEGAFSSIRFVPHKRFAPPITIYYGPEDEERIVTMLSNHLPMEDHKIDSVDRLMRRIRF